MAPNHRWRPGHTIDNDGRRWTITLRDHLRFHDGEPVRGRDVVASIRRFCARESFGQSLWPPPMSFPRRTTGPSCSA